MNIVVCVKQVVDTEAVIALDGAGEVELTGQTMVIDPYSEFAVERAVQLKEELGGTVTLLTLGSQDCLAAVRHDGTLPYLRPDGKTQVTVRYEDGKPVEVTTIVISTQHAAEIEDMGKIKNNLIEHVITPVMAAENMPWDNADIYVNPTGRFVVGGPMGDTGLTGRKIIVDTYGGYGRHGGGAFSGKDCTKVDRSAAYAMRWVAKNVVAAGLASRCEVQIAYAIGVAQPVSLMVDTFGTAKVPEADIEKAINEVFDLRPGAIIDALDLRRPIYRKTAAYGHFGRELPEFTWERTDRAEALRKACGLE